MLGEIFNGAAAKVRRLVPLWRCLILGGLTLAVLLCGALEPFSAVYAEGAGSGGIYAIPNIDALLADASSVILIEAETGTVLYEKEADVPRAPASVTKVMTMLLVMEAIDSGRISYDEQVTVSENAAKMGGSQVYLEPGEQLSVRDMLKCVVVSSANDAAVALAEHISGSAEGFVAEMNRRAGELGMSHTCFENTNGLDDTTQNHVTSARDIAIMSAELITEHPAILEFSSIWMDSIRGGEFTLTNTNRLIRFYNGANGLKTGSTSKAGFCISASAKRGDTQLICVVMGASTRDSRNAIAKKLFDLGFAGYAYESFPAVEPEPVRVLGGTRDSVSVRYDGYELVSEKKDAGRMQITAELPESVSAPIRKGDTVGRVVYTLDGEVIHESAIYALEDVERIGFFGQLCVLMRGLLY